MKLDDRERRNKYEIVKTKVLKTLARPTCVGKMFDEYDEDARFRKRSVVEFYGSY